MDAGLDSGYIETHKAYIANALKELKPEWAQTWWGGGKQLGSSAFAT